jgi:hypothetical protein
MALRVIFLVMLCKVLLLSILGFGYLLFLVAVAMMTRGTSLRECWPLLLFLLFNLGFIVGVAFGVRSVARSLKATRMVQR